MNRTLVRSLSACLALLPLTAGAAPVPDGVAVSRDLVYAAPDGIPQLLDLYRPAEPSRPLPVVVWVHGGGWKNGSKGNCPGVFLAKHGYAVASIDYRLTDTACWPAQINDCRTAVQFLRDHAAEYHLDAKHIAAWGGSAGGHLAALMGTLDAPENEQTSSRVQAVIDFYGPADLLTMPPNTPSPDKTEKDLANSNGAKLLGGTVRDRPKLARQASALYNVSKDDPPFLIVHGEKDPGVPLSQSRRLHDKLRAAGVPSKLVVIPGAGHGGKEFRTPEVQAVILKFLDENLK